MATHDRRSLYLLLSLLIFILLTPFVEHHRVGEVLLLFAMYVTLVVSIMDFHGKQALGWLAIAVAVPFLCIEVASLFHPIHRLVIVGYALLTVFFAFAAIGLFTYLGQPGAITSGRVYASASLYLMLALLWFGLYNVMEAIYPGSFAETGSFPLAKVSRPNFLYFSLITLTTVGYGDIVPISPVARVFAGLEGVTGVLYIAITVARLVAAYQSAESDSKVVEPLGKER